MKIVVCTVNSPRFIRIQYETLKRHFKAGPYELLVFNDAKDWPDYSNGGDPNMRTAIRNVCEALQIQCIDIPNEKHKDITDAGQRCADAYNFVLEYQLRHPDIYLGLDSDMFLIDDFYGFHGNHSAAVVLQTRGPITYFWNGLYVFNLFKMKDLRKLNWDPLPSTDVGGAMTRWLRHAKVFPIDHVGSGTWSAQDLRTFGLARYPKLEAFLNTDPRNKDSKYYYCELYHRKFLHYRGGGNWTSEKRSSDEAKEAFAEQRAREVYLCEVLEVPYEENGVASQDVAPQ